MEPQKVVFYKVITLPSVLTPNAFYYIKVPGDEYVDYVLTDDAGIPYEVISNERIQSLILPYDDSVLPVNGQILIFDGTNYVPQDLPTLEVPDSVLDHISNTNNPHNVTEDQIPDGITYTLIFENALL